MAGKTERQKEWARLIKNPDAWMNNILDRLDKFDTSSKQIVALVANEVKSSLSNELSSVVLQLQKSFKEDVNSLAKQLLVKEKDDLASTVLQLRKSYEEDLNSIAKQLLTKDKDNLAAVVDQISQASSASQQHLAQAIMTNSMCISKLRSDVKTQMAKRDTDNTGQNAAVTSSELDTDYESTFDALYQ